MNSRIKVLILVVMLGGMSVLAGCMSGASSDAAFLLEEDYLRMNDTELVAYEQELSDELLNANRGSGNDVGVGIGFGSWGSNLGVGLHADKWFGGDQESDTARDLRFRRAEVREEMRRRGLLPE